MAHDPGPPGPVARLDRWVAGPDPERTSRRVFLVVLGLLVVVFGVTSSWTTATNDPRTNAITGWYLGNDATVILDRHTDLYDHRNTIAWVVESPRGPVSQYPPGAAVVAALAYAVTPGDLATTTIDVRRFDERVTFLQPPLWPATATAVLVTALACACLAAVFLRIGGSPAEAVLGGLLLGLGTGAWSVAANMPWTHGPGMLCVSLGVWAAARDRWWLAGLALGAGVLVRPHLAVVAAVLGVVVAVARRRWRPVVAVGVSSSLGLVALLAYNAWLWGTVTISGGYGGGFADRVVTADTWWFVRNVALGLVSPVNGVLVWAPFLLVLVPAAWFARHRQPDWAVGAALGGLAYLLLQWRANRYTGGAAFFAYRYPIEAITAGAAALFVGYDAWVRGRPRVMRWLTVLTVVAVTGQAVGAVLS